MPSEHMLSLEDMILIMFMHKIGFDILIFVPTCYRSIDGLVTAKFQYEVHNIGYAVYDIETKYLEVRPNEAIDSNSSLSSEKKKGFFSRLFGG